MYTYASDGFGVGTALLIYVIAPARILALAPSCQGLLDNSGFWFGLDGWIRTSDLPLPRRPDYQAFPRPGLERLGSRAWENCCGGGLAALHADAIEARVLTLRGVIERWFGCEGGI